MQSIPIPLSLNNIQLIAFNLIFKISLSITIIVEVFNASLKSKFKENSLSLRNPKNS